MKSSTWQDGDQAIGATPNTHLASTGDASSKASNSHRLDHVLITDMTTATSTVVADPDINDIITTDSDSNDIITTDVDPPNTKAALVARLGVLLESLPLAFKYSGTSPPPPPPPPPLHVHSQQPPQPSKQYQLAPLTLLRPYQTVGVQWIQWLLNSGLSGILVPLSLISNWEAEFKHFAPSMPVATMQGTMQQRDAQKALLVGCSDSVVLLTTYETVISETLFLKTFEWKYLVVDEAHRLKNAASILHQRLLELNCRYKLLLTGTPIQNHLTDLQGLLSFTNPHLFDTDTCRLEDWFGVRASPGSVDTLAALLKPLILRRTKEDVADIPKMNQVVIYAPMTPLQRQIYLSVVSKDWSVFDGKQVASLRNVLMQLRKCVAHPYLFDNVEPEPFNTGEHLIESSGKMMALDQILNYAALHNRRVLIFSQMTRMLDIVQDYLTLRQYSYERLDGSVRGNERYVSVNTFQQGETFVFLLSTRSGGVGLNLTTADTVVFMDVDFNPTMDQQAAARVHRIGQTKPTTVIRIICPDTVDDIIWRRAQRKLHLQERMMANDSLGISDTETQKSNSLTRSSHDLVAMLQFGIGTLTSEDADTATSKLELSPDDLDSIFNPKEVDTTDICVISKDGAQMGVSYNDDPDVDKSIYVYQGRDYKTDTSALEALRQHTEQPTSPAHIPISIRKRRLAGSDDDDDDDHAQRLHLRRNDMEQRRRDRKFSRYVANGYTSCVLDDSGCVETSDDPIDALASTSDSHDYSDPLFTDITPINRVLVDDEDTTSMQLMYASGDVTYPQTHSDGVAIIVHVVDNSGIWPNLGVFRSISTLSPAIREYYEKSSRDTIRTLSMGSAHLVPVPERPKLLVALIVAQTATTRDRININAFESGLIKIAQAAIRLRASVHLPRIGHNLPHVSWYTVERIIAKILPRRGVLTTIYYHGGSR
ncbi:hypothetical protein BASA61_002687 [Batrachochytrium salamandrivorans]|nr:hypothetical protein BASA60_005116 [Batrachochytrium salamandrivorans]KAH6599155.1 hypothetical protein BASA61_002687 [Batrachochytrium salamandrivorans]